MLHRVVAGHRGGPPAGPAQQIDRTGGLWGDRTASRVGAASGRATGERSGVEDHAEYHKPTDDFATIPQPFFRDAVATVVSIGLETYASGASS